MFVTVAECSRCGNSFSCDRVLTVCPNCDGALLYRYDLARVAEKVTKNVFEERNDTFWKFMELLPLSSYESIISLGEPYTPVLRLSTLGNVHVKDDGRLPTGTFKARGVAVAVSKLKEMGVKRIAIPSAGNAAAALAAYGAKAGIEVHAFMPKDVPESILKECVYLGAKVYLVDGLIHHAAEIVGRFAGKYDWFDFSTNKQPYRTEGYKAMAFEIAEQFHWKPLDSILFPTGGGEGIVGLWKGFKELVELHWITRIPRLIAVQSSGCAPLVEAYKRKDSEVTEPWKDAETIAAGLRAPHPYASYLVLQAIRETRGTVVAVDDKNIIASMKALFREGFYACPEAASTLAALSNLRDENVLDEDENTLLYLTGNAMKYLDVMKLEKGEIPVLDKKTSSLP